jgi:hypothetical protein
MHRGIDMNVFVSGKNTPASMSMIPATTLSYNVSFRRRAAVDTR